MAASSSFVSEDHFLCSICLELFTRPVSIPCGHNFCKSCIARHWEGKEQRQCPLCKEKFDKGLKLCVNTEFREIVENFKKHQETAASCSPIKAGQVPCDYCLDNKVKASKTCLVCLTSYCETHLEPHRKVEALKRHKLTSPVHKLENKICEKHNRILEFFCRDDRTRVCALCSEHDTHDTVPLNEAYVDKRAQMGRKMGRKKAEVQDIRHKHGKKGQKNKKSGKDEEAENCPICKQMQGHPVWHFSNEGPQEFSTYYYLPSFSEGRICYMFLVKELISWDLGVVRESVVGKTLFRPNPRNGNWIIKLKSKTKCIALERDPVHIFMLRKPERVFLYVDYAAGLVSFTDGDTGSLIYCFRGCKFNERIFLCFTPGPAEVSWTQKLRNMAERMKTGSPLTLLWFILIISLFSFFDFLHHPVEADLDEN